MLEMKGAHGAGAHVATRTTDLFHESLNNIHRHTDRLFLRLMLVQWLAGIVAAIWISPRAWSGASSQVHIHVLAAIFLGGAITMFPVLLAILRPGATITRHAVAA